MVKNIEYYEARYPRCRSLSEYLSSKVYHVADKLIGKYCRKIEDYTPDDRVTPKAVSEVKTGHIDTDVPDMSAALFGEDTAKNERAVNAILEKVGNLEIRYQQLFGNSEDDQVYIHTVSKAKTKLEKLVEKMKKTSLPSGKLANELVKIMESTLVKNLASPRLYGIVDNFLIDCGFKKVELLVGKRLTDDDYRYISDTPLEIPVKDASKHRTLVEKKHDAYTLFYIDEDDGMLERIIAGDYVIGRYYESEQRKEQI